MGRVQHTWAHTRTHRHARTEAQSNSGALTQPTYGHTLALAHTRGQTMQDKKTTMTNTHSPETDTRN